MSLLLCAAISTSLAAVMPHGVRAEDAALPEIEAKSAILVDSSTGTVFFECNADEAYSPASVTKIMTLLLIMEAIDSGDVSLTDTVTVSEHAASMGGSQIYLKVGEQMSADELIKSIAVASANDAALAMAEATAGSEDAFVARMNRRAEELGMKNTHFENVTGLDDSTVDHLTSARDIAIMSRELMKHDKIFNYTKVWTDSIRDGQFGLTNTNRLIRFYKGATGLKTGSTSKAGFCISATAERNGMHLIAVIMGSQTRDSRNESAKALLDWGFANYEMFKSEAGSVGNIAVHGGVSDFVEGVYPEVELTVKKGESSHVVAEYLPDEFVYAPVSGGQKIGTVIYRLDGESIYESDITAKEDVSKIGFFTLFVRMIAGYLMK